MASECLGDDDEQFIDIKVVIGQLLGDAVRQGRSEAAVIEDRRIHGADERGIHAAGMDRFLAQAGPDLLHLLGRPRLYREVIPDESLHPTLHPCHWLSLKAGRRGRPAPPPACQSPRTTSISASISRVVL